VEARAVINLPTGCCSVILWTHLPMVWAILFLLGGTMKVCDIFRCFLILLTQQVEKLTHAAFPSIDYESN
jgi:hypothetical protein